MTPRPDHDDSIIGWLAKTRRECKHNPPLRGATGIPIGIVDTCKCGKTHYEMRWANKDGTRREWKYMKGPRP